MEPHWTRRATPVARAFGPAYVREAPDVETCTEGYARRFAGPVGEWFLEVQAQAVLGMLAAYPQASVLDIGGGHGQLVGPLAEQGYAVTVLGSQPNCHRRIAGLLEQDRCRFAAGDLQRLPFADRSFDVVLSVRTLAHLSSWALLLAEMVRVAGKTVVFDFPSSRSLNALTPQLFGLKKRIEGNTRPYKVIREQDLVQAVSLHGFRLARRQPQFVLPMAAHRALGNRPLSDLAERNLRRLGLTARFGSPAIVQFTRGGP